MSHRADSGLHRAPPKYQQQSRAHIRAAHARHPYAHHIRKLPGGLRVLLPELNLATGERILDYGCADRPYLSLFPTDVEYVGADLIGNSTADLTLNPDGTVPAQDETFDAVLSTQVLEHVADPGLYLRECHRLLRSGGRLLLSTHGVFPYHPDPVDLWRWTGAGLCRALEEAGFAVIRLEGIIGLAATGLQLFQDAISYRLPRRLVPWLALFMQPIIAFVDRFETPNSLRDNAQVFAIVAAKP